MSSHGQRSSSTSSMSMQYAPGSVPLQSYGVSPQNFQLTTAIGSDGTPQQR